jgi:hypothetical protein
MIISIKQYKMKNIIIPVYAIMFLLIACNSNSDNTKESIPKENVTVDTTIQTDKPGPVTEQLYACSMHPEVTGKKGEKCPKCGMNLTVPVKK